MSLYIDFPAGGSVANDSSNGDTNPVVCSAWCKSESLLAIAYAEKGVRFYSEEGDILENCHLERNYCDAVSLDWRVRSKVVASGWEDGAVTLWNVKDQSLKEDSSVHTSRVSLVQWSPEGGRLLSADSNGTVAVWRTDYRGRLSVVCKRDIGNGSEISCCAWMLSAEYRDQQHELPSPPQNVFVGTKTGSIALLNLKGELVASARLSCGLRTINWFEEEQRLVVITEDCNKIQLRYQDGLSELEQVRKVKLSMGSAATAAAGVQQAIWASPGLLATCAPESMVRFWDIANDSSYFLSYNGSGNVAASEDDVISSICFNPRTRVLAASTTNGKIFLWRFIGASATQVEVAVTDGSDKFALDDEIDNNIENNSGEISDDKENEISVTRKEFRYPPSSSTSWEAIAALEAISAPIQELAWGPRESSLAVIMTNGRCSIMNETTLHRTLRSDVAAIQISAQNLLVQRGGSSRMETHCGLRIKGIDVNDTHVLVWNQKKAEVYEFQEDRMNKLATFPCKAESMALYGETVLQANGSQIDVCNLQGVARKSIAFSKVEGEPRLLHVNGKFLAVATTKGFLKVFDVSRREPRAIGSGTQFVGQQRSRSGKTVKTMSIGEIRSIRCNCDGTRVSVQCDIMRGQFMCEPDTRLHVWNTDSDELQSFDFGPQRFPISHSWEGQEPKLLACEAKRVSKSIHSFDDKTGGSEFAQTSSDRALRGSRLRNTDETDFMPVGNDGKEDKEQDAEKARLQQMRVSRTASDLGGKHTDAAEVEVVTLFATHKRELGVMMQDSFPLEQGLDALIGIKVPLLFFISKPVDGFPKLKGRMMRDFVGLDKNNNNNNDDDDNNKNNKNNADGVYSSNRTVKVDEKTKRAMIDFSYYLTIGNMDEAYRAVKLIDNVSVWENMAHMCVKTRRLDVAEMCMGNMGHARGATALRESKVSAPNDPDAQIAMVAVQLGLLDDAERLYVDCGRYDLLNKMLRASGQWTKALEVANSYDRIHLRETHFSYGRHLESVDDWNAAVANYEASGTHRKQVPRMLFTMDRLDELETYVQSQCDRELTQWWGQYLESQSDFQRAVHVYLRAGDELSLVRVHCCMGNFPAAAEIALGSTSSAASYYLARQCEQRGDIQEAIQFYSRAGRYNHAVRLAKESGMDREIVNLALRASRATMIEAARYLESKRLFEDAVVLYQKGGNIPRALDLCFRAELFDLLTNIADSLSANASEGGSANNKNNEDENGDRDSSNNDDGPAGKEQQLENKRQLEELQKSPEILSRCAEFFIEHRKFDKAVQLYITAQEFETALDLCFNQKVSISEDIADRMTLDKMSVDKKYNPGLIAKAKAHNERRQQLLMTIAKCCKKQQSFHLATKKYTQAGDRLKAMKCLLRSGDTKKIIFFAGVSRSKEIYILAANYLQNLDWRNDPEIMKAIIGYYTKAKAFSQLSGFYDACGQFEIDEYREYDKALGAFKEAVKYLGKVSPDGEDAATLKEDQLISLQQRISLVERFVHAQKLIVGDPEEASRVCNALLAHPEVATAIRVGDVYAMLVDFHHKNKNMDMAYKLVEKMKQHGVAVVPYINRSTLDSISRAVGIDLVEDEIRGTTKDDIMNDVEDEIDGELWSHK